MQRGEAVFGYTVDLPGLSDKYLVDSILSDFKNWSDQGFAGVGRTLLDSSVISGTNNIGDKSSGIRQEYMAGGNHIVLEHINFRIDDIYAITVVKNFTGTDPLISVSDVARVYASSIQNPVRYCQITHISQVEGATWPSYDFVAEGFYPGEARMINLTGDVQIGGETQSVKTALLGLTGETADGEGHIEGNVTFGMVAGEDVTLPDEFLFSILGYYSECEVSQIVAWSEPSYTPTTPTQIQTPTLTTTPTKTPTRTRTPSPTASPTKKPTRTRTPSPTASPTKKPTSTKIVDLLPSNACAPGESLLYIEDFQDGSADGWPTIGGQEIPWSIVPDPYTAGNIVVKRVVDQDSSATLEGYIFENAVWRAQFMPIGSPIFNFAWHWHGGGYKVDGVTVDWSSYNIWFHPPGLRTFRAQPPISTDMLRNINQTMESDVWHQLEIGTFEGVLDIWIDGTRFLSYQDPNPLPAGKVVLGTVYDEALGTVSTVYFDDLVICELTKPFAPMPTSEP